MRALDDFVVFILSHGRADNVITAKTLKKCGYNGNLVIVIDNEDEQENEYRKRFKRVEVFDKKEISMTFDTMDLSNDRRTIVYARNACFDIAKKLGYRYFLELDDDYMSFEYRYVRQSDNKLLVQKCRDLTKVFAYMLDFLDESGAQTVAFAQGGDFIGGSNSGTYNQRLLRKAMNTFFCDIQKPFKFIGRINEDVNTYTVEGSRGWLGLSVCDVSIVQKQTQKNKGGMSDVYIDGGTFVKSFYSVMAMPSAVKVGVMGDTTYRYHHNINWEKCVPKILNEKVR